MSSEGLPANYEWFSDQIAGHHPSVIKNGKREIGLLKCPGTQEVLKLKQNASRGEKEVALYETLKLAKNGQAIASSSTEFRTSRREDVLALSQLTATYYGLKTLQVDGETHEFLVLDDVTAPYSLPAILDLKMGKVTSDPLATPEKRNKEAVKWPPQAKLGLRILGYHIHRSSNDVTARDKDWGKSFNENNIHEGILEFFSARKGETKSVVSAALHSLEPIMKFFEVQKSFQFYASSLLFVYESDLSKAISMRVILIDFSHAFSTNGEGDDGYLFGLKNLHTILSRLAVQD